MVLDVPSAAGRTPPGTGEDVVRVWDGRRRRRRWRRLWWSRCRRRRCNHWRSRLSLKATKRYAHDSPKQHKSPQAKHGPFDLSRRGFMLDPFSMTNIENSLATTHVVAIP